MDIGYNHFVLALRITPSVVFFVQIVLLIFRICLEFWTEQMNELQNLAPVSVTRVVLFLLLAEALLQWNIYLYDFGGAYGVASPLAINVITYMVYPNDVLIFCVLLTYWIDFYHALVMKLKKEQMLKRLNTSYSGAVSFDDIIMQVNQMRKVKICMATLCVVSYAVWILEIIGIKHGRNAATVQLFLKLYFAWWALVWIVIGAGFLIFGVRLARVLPSQMSGRMKRLTRKVSAVAVVLLLNNIIGVCINAPTIIGRPGTTLFLCKVAITISLTAIARFFWIDIYLPFYEVKRWLNLTWSKPSSGTTSKSKNNEAEAQIETERQPEHIV